MGIPILLLGALALVLVAVAIRGMRGGARPLGSTPDPGGDDVAVLAMLAAGADSGGSGADSGVDAGCDGGSGGSD